MQKYFLASEPVSPYRYAPEQGKEIDGLVTAARRELDKDKRNALYGQAQMLIAEGNFWMPLTHERMLVVYNKTKVSGVKPHGLTGNGLYKGLDFAPAK
jgi:ABC-type transport system substrate-binding protein